MQLRRTTSASLSAAVAFASTSTSTSTSPSSSNSTFSSSNRPRPRSLSSLLPQRRTGSRSAVCAPVAVFTGIVQGTATVSSVEKRGVPSSPSSASSSASSAKFTLQFPPGALAGVAAGGSIAVNGTCLTVVAADEARSVCDFDVVGETLRVTSLGRLSPGSRANFERAARVGDEIGGHLVSGHVCCVARVEEVERQGDGGGGGGKEEAGNENENGGNVRMRFRVPARWGKYILPKGFVSLDGCSLTVGPDVATSRAGGEGAGDAGASTSFSVFFIPETLRVTRFGEVGVGDAVNVEVDATTQAVVDAVERAVDARIEERLGAKGLL